MKKLRRVPLFLLIPSMIACGGSEGGSADDIGVGGTAGGNKDLAESGGASAATGGTEAGTGGASPGVGGTTPVGGDPDCPAVPETMRIRYASATVAVGEDCLTESQEITCVDGAWTEWSGSFTFESCEPAALRACGEVASGEYASRVRYQSASVPSGSECAPQEQQALCSDGSLGDWSGSATYEVCVVGEVEDCDGGKHGDAASRTRYATASVPFGQSCVSEEQTQVCNDGTWSAWSGSYSFTTCSEEAAASCGATPHGGSDSRVRFESDSVGSDETCLSETQTRDCSDGSWSGWSGSYSALTCEKQLAIAGSCAIGSADGQLYLCTDYIGSVYDAAYVEAVCPNGATLTRSADPCVVGVGYLGTCLQPSTEPNSEYESHYFESVPYPDGATAESTCTLLGGSWSVR